MKIFNINLNSYTFLNNTKCLCFLQKAIVWSGMISVRKYSPIRSWELVRSGQFLTSWFESKFSVVTSALITLQGNCLPLTSFPRPAPENLGPGGRRGALGAAEAVAPWPRRVDCAAHFPFPQLTHLTVLPKRPSGSQRASGWSRAS